MFNILQQRWSRVSHKIEQCSKTGCHIWTGGRNNSGHGVIMVQGKRHYVHRVSYIVNHGTITTGSDIHHTCHNPACVNPKHLKCLSKKEHRAEHIVYYRPPPAECKHGHKGKYKKNSQGRWVCQECVRVNSSRYYESRTGRQRMWTFKKKNGKS